MSIKTEALRQPTATPCHGIRLTGRSPRRVRGSIIAPARPRCKEPSAERLFGGQARPVPVLPSRVKNVADGY